MDKNSKNNIFGGVSVAGGELFSAQKNENTFLSQENPKKQKMINDFDSALIIENIDKNVKNKAVKINLKINTLEKNLSRINDEYELLKLLNLEKDVQRREELKKFKDYLEKEINDLKLERKRFGIWYFISGFFADRVDCEAIRANINILKDEIKKYDKAAISFLKSKNPDLLPFKW